MKILRGLLIAGIFLHLIHANVLNSQNKYKRNPVEIAKGYMLFVNDFHVPIYSSTSKESLILDYLKYGTPINQDNEYRKEFNKHWLSIEVNSSISGYMMRKQILEFPIHKKFRIVSKDIDTKLKTLNSYPNEQSFYELIDYLFSIVNEGEFIGNEYLYMKMKGGEALGILLTQIPEEKLSINFLKKYEIYLTRYQSKNFRIDENYFWKYASLNRNSRFGDQFGQLAVEYSYRPECNGDVVCTLDWLNSSYLKYLESFPRGARATLYSKLVLQIMKEFLYNKDNVRCFPPVPDSDWRSLALTEYRTNFIVAKYINPIKSLISELRKECFPRL